MVPELLSRVHIINGLASARILVVLLVAPVHSRSSLILTFRLLPWLLTILNCPGLVVKVARSKSLLVSSTQTSTLSHQLVHKLSHLIKSLKSLHRFVALLNYLINTLSSFYILLRNSSLRVICLFQLLSQLLQLLSGITEIFNCLLFFKCSLLINIL